MDDERRISVFILLGANTTDDLRSNMAAMCEAIAREAAVFDAFDSVGFQVDDSHKFDVECFSSPRSLDERIEQVVAQPMRTSLIVLSDELVTIGSCQRTEASQFAQRIRAMFLADQAVQYGHLCGLVALVHGEPRRVKDIDWVVDTGSADLSELKTAVNKTAHGLWMKTPRSSRSSKAPM